MDWDQYDIYVCNDFGYRFWMVMGVLINDGYGNFTNKYALNADITRYCMVFLWRRIISLPNHDVFYREEVRPLI